MSRRVEFFDDSPGPLVKFGFALWFVICAAVSLAFLGLCAWAVITLVQWVVTK